MSAVPFLDLRSAYLELQPEIDGAVARVLDSGMYILGPEVEAFEGEFSAYCGVGHAVGVANGLDALHLALLAMDVGPGDEVIVPAHTYIATWLAVSHCGATPVPVECAENTFNLDPRLVRAAITDRAKVILPVHLYGQPADLEPILAIASEFGLRVLEDAAQAHGAIYRGRRIGSHGDAVAWSFYPGKNLGAVGDGGAITTNNAAIAERLRMLRNYGSQQKYVNVALGYNSRLDPLQAAVLRVKLRHLDAWNARRAELAARYTQGLSAIGISAPYVPEWAQPAWHLFVIRHPRRDQLQKWLADAGIGPLIHYPIAAFDQEPYRSLGHTAKSFPLAARFANEMLSLPMGPHVTASDVDAVVSAIAAFPGLYDV